MINWVLVGVDGSDGSRRAAEFARSLARSFRARLTVVHVVEPLSGPAASGFGLPEGELRQRQLREGQQVLDELCRELELEGAEKVLDGGRAAEALCAAAEDRQADVIVIGAHGFGPHRQMPGSIAARLAGMADRTLTIVR